MNLDTKYAMKKLVGIEKLKQADPKYAKKVEEVKMSASSITIGLGLDNNIDLQSLGLDCGYNVLTTGRNTFENLFKAFDKDEFI